MVENKYRVGHPEFIEEAKRLGLTPYNYRCRLVQERKLVNPTDIERIKLNKTAKNAGFDNTTEYHNHLAKISGYSDDAEYQRETSWNAGRRTPMSENYDCTLYFGVHIVERILTDIFKEVTRMHIQNPGFDFICKNGKKIDTKARCLEYHEGWMGWNFGIDYNKVADYFLLVGFDNRDSMYPMHIWLIKGKDIIRKRKLNEFKGLGITNKPGYIAEFKKYEIVDKLEKMRDCCDKIKSDI